LKWIAVSVCFMCSFISLNHLKDNSLIKSLYRVSSIG
jgi:hypothetical protein